MKPYLWTISMRYLMARRTSMLSLVTLISVVGVALGVAVLIFVLSVLGGFATDLREKILGTKAHLVVSADHGDLAGAEAIMDLARQQPHVVGASAYVESRVLVSSATNVEGVVLRGIDTENVGETSALVDNIVDGDLEWLHDPGAAVFSRSANLPPRYQDLEQEADRIRQELEALERSIDDAESFREEWRRRRNTDGEAAPDGSGEGSGGFVMPLLPGQPRPSPPEPAPPGPAASRGTGLGLMPLLPGQGGNDANMATPGNQADRPNLFTPGPGIRARRDAPGVIIGTMLAEALHIAVGDELTIISPDGQLLPTGPAPLSRPYTVVGLFYSGLYEFDRRFAYVLSDQARDLFRMEDDAFTAVDIKIDNIERASGVEIGLDGALTAAGIDNVLVRSWEKLNSSLFSALKLEKFALFIILTIIILVASFSIASSLVVMVIERSQEIGILKSMGATNREIMGIFAIAGGVIGAIGTTLGVVVGVGLCVALQTYGFPLDTEVYYIEYLPVHLEPVEVTLTALAGMVISLGSTIYPAIKAARLSPAEALREE